MHMLFSTPYTRPSLGHCLYQITSNYSVSALQLHEAWDLLESMKKLVDDDRGRARSLLEAYPQLIGALIEVQVQPLASWHT